MQLISTVFKEEFRKKTNGFHLKKQNSDFVSLKKIFFIIVSGLLQWKSDDWQKSCWVRSV